MTPSMRMCLSALLLAAYLAGCGQKGPLFLPKPTAETPKRGATVKPAPAPAPELPAPAEAPPAPQ